MVAVSRNGHAEGLPADRGAQGCRCPEPRRTHRRDARRRHHLQRAQPDLYRMEGEGDADGRERRRGGQARTAPCISSPATSTITGTRSRNSPTRRRRSPRSTRKGSLRIGMEALFERAASGGRGADDRAARRRLLRHRQERLMVRPRHRGQARKRGAHLSRAGRTAACLGLSAGSGEGLRRAGGASRPVRPVRDLQFLPATR